MSAIIDREEILKSLDQGTGQGVKVGLLDTGVDEDHEDLQGKIEASYELVESGGKYECRVVKGSDQVGHGTACAAIIKSIAPDAEIHSVKVIGANSKGSSAGLVAGMNWCVREGMNIINASLGTLERRSRESISDAVDEAILNGVVVVAAANNGGFTAYPANLSSVISVDNEAMPDPLKIRYRLGTPIELQAHGIYVEAPSPGGGHKFYTGTSFACPHASAIVARLLSVYPDLQPFEVRSLMWHLGKE